MGSTQERLREVFTSAPPGASEVLTEEGRQKKQRDFDTRQYFEDEISRCLSENVQFALKNYQLYSAVDLAWDASPVNKNTFPMILYAQGKLDLGQCAKSLESLRCADQYVTKNDKGEAIGINVPKFYEVNINLVRSVITRRLAAQANKFANLYPHYKYESRSTSMTGKLRADIVSQVVDIMSDQFDYKHHEIQVFRDTLLYGHSVDFMRSAWEREIQWAKDDVPEEIEGKEPKLKTVIVKEGVGWTNPHPSRVYWDNNYPLASINTDTGCEYVGFWDVVRWKDISKNTKFWNRDAVGYTASQVQLFSTYAQYFSQYYCTITPPCGPNGQSVPCSGGGNYDLTGQNDRKNNIGLYAQSLPEAALVIAHDFRKIIPKDHGIGNYPYPVWVHFWVAGYNTVVYAEFMPTTPAAYCGYNENDSRQVNISVAHELMAYQDQMTNLMSLLLLTIKSDNQKILVLDLDALTPEAIKTIREQAKGKNYYTETLVIEASRSKMREMGINLDHIVELVETRSGQAVNVIFQAMLQLLQLAERMMALSPQEQGQPAPRETTATETNVIAGTTESVYGFISDGFDEFRNAKKRISYESYMAFGNPTIRVPVINRYSKKVVEMAGFAIVEDEEEDFSDPNLPKRHTITGDKRKLFYDYIFTSRDGAERSVNTQSANVLVQLMGILQSPIIAAAVGKEKLYEIVNEIFRMSGAGVDLKLELKEGEDNAIGVDVNQQVQQILGQLTSEAEQNSAAIQKLTQMIQGVGQNIAQLQQELKDVKNSQNVAAFDAVKIESEREKMRLEKIKAAHELTLNQESHDQALDLETIKTVSDINNKTRQKSAYSPVAA